jgi:peptidoglycan/xylan/chitin deacetylase (PgdA/CDA1 family)
MKRRLKHWLGQSAFATGAYRRFFQQRAVITLFHRVDDRLAGNPISCTVDEFRRYCDFFRRYFVVVGMGELLDRIARGEDISRHLVITFDDGYKDNSEIAAQVLEAAGLPACFFIATNFIESQRVPWWDAELGITPEWMSWQDVRSLRRRGFELGAHTMNHVDLGVVTGDEAIAEIVGSGQRLTAETREPVPYFSYPYGRVHQITEANRDAVRDAGYSCCLSAYGGSVKPRTDPYSIRRMPISPWFISPYHFGFEAMLERG